MDVVCFHDLNQLTPYADALEEVSLASRRKDPFSTVSFIRNLAEHPDWYPGDRDVQPWFLIALKQGKPVGYLALRRVVLRVLGSEAAKLEFFVTHDNDCPQLVAPPELEAEVSVAFYGYLLGRGDEWSLLEFHQQDPGSALIPLPDGVNAGGYYVRTLPTRENNTIPLHWASLEEYFEALSSRFRGEVRRRARRLLSAGAVSWVSSEDPRTTPVLLELLRTIEPHCWKSDLSIALGSHPDRLAFFRGLLAPDQAMKIRIGVLMLNGIPIAGSLCGSYAGAHYGLVVLFDDRAQSLAPGVMAQTLMLRTAIQGGYRELNLLGSYAYYKARWLAEPLPTRSAQLFRIGKPWFWKAILGDLKRRVLAGVAPVAAEQADFNPDRRTSAENASESHAPLIVTPVERSELERLFAQLAALPADRLGPEELAAVIPFGVPSVPKRPKGPRVPSEEAQATAAAGR